MLKLCSQTSPSEMKEVVMAALNKQMPSRDISNSEVTGGKSITTPLTIVACSSPKELLKSQKHITIITKSGCK
jgi:hypothetical protein